MERIDRVQFACPQCKTTLVVDRKYAGLSVSCSGCLRNVPVPLGAAAFVPPEEAGPPKTPDGLAFRRCPFCTEYVNPHALKCDHCGHKLETQETPSTWQLNKGEKRTSGYAIAATLFAIVPVLCLLAILFGHKALRQIKRSGVLYKGEGLAEWSLGCAYFFSIGYLIAFIVWLVR
jgi:ribosomal protein L37AE/L43A